MPIQELGQLGLGDSVSLHVCEIPVEYQAIQRLMPSLWEKHQPQVCKKTLSDFRLPPATLDQPVNSSLPSSLPSSPCGFCGQLVVHVGVSGLATTVTLEQCGHNHGYQRLDNCSYCPATQCCIENGPDCLRSLLDMNMVCRRVNGSELGVTLSVSEDAGR